MRHQIGWFEEMMADTVETLYEIVLDNIEANLYDIIGFDSWGSVLTQVAQDAGMGDRLPGGAALVNTMFINKLSGVLSVPRDGRMNYTSLVGINQYRQKIGGRNMRGGDLSNMNIQGGHAMKHMKLVSIYLEGSHVWKDVGGRKQRTGRKVRWTIIKGKAGCHDGATGEFEIVYGKGLDVIGANLMAALKRGIVTQRGPWMYLIDPRDGTEVLKAQGKDRMVAQLEQDPAVVKWMEEATLRTAIEDGASIITNYIPPEDV
jgi:hypothetical protein